MDPTTPPNCPLCRSDGVHPFASAHGRRYFDCQTCRLVFLAPEQRLDPGAERARYETHRNDPADEGYRAFLSRLAAPLAERLPPGAEGLDYGSGPGPTLSLMLEEQGFHVEIYDPFFCPNPAALERSYDFVTCTETVEHFFRPREEFERLGRLLRPGGWLGVMTEVLLNDAAFERWYYVRDETHVCFYRPATLEWLAAHFGWGVNFPHRNVALFHKAPDAPATAK